MTVLNAIIQHNIETEIQAVYAIQYFINKLEHPPRHAIIEMSTKDFFRWLEQAKTDLLDYKDEDEEEERN
ncbi:unnamed protein product [Rotaria sp. Silwood1]|nr:unnamed protein product [Rotaria sp. Silwood1]CAF5079786.1 unnamed protein product [Rotaria sp. Silwood1]